MRQIGVSYSGFVDESYTLLSLFDDVEQIEKDNRLQTAIDVVREQFGFLAIQILNAVNLSVVIPRVDWRD